MDCHYQNRQMIQRKGSRGRSGGKNSNSNNLFCLEEMILDSGVQLSSLNPDACWINPDACWINQSIFLTSSSKIIHRSGGYTAAAAGAIEKKKKNIIIFMHGLICHYGGMNLSIFSKTAGFELQNEGGKGIKSSESNA